MDFTTARPQAGSTNMLPEKSPRHSFAFPRNKTLYDLERQCCLKANANMVEHSCKSVHVPNEVTHPPPTVGRRLPHCLNLGNDIMHVDGETCAVPASCSAGNKGYPCTTYVDGDQPNSALKFCVERGVSTSEVVV